jgi:3-oxoacyl-[acyl-carrier protein] reductase
LDVLVNNAGGAPSPQYPEAPLEHWSHVLDLNLRSVMRATQLALPLLAVRGGVVINISSIAAIGQAPHSAPAYAAAKAGVMRLTSSLVFLAESSGVRVNAICPDIVDTPASRRSRASMSDEQLAKLPVVLTPSEVAEVALSLTRDEMAVGRTVVIQGGRPPWTLA